MPRPRNTTPTLRFHKPSGHAYLDYRCPVTDRRRSVSLGKWGSPEARTEHARLLTELAAGQAAPSTGPTVSELCLAYLRFAEGYYLKDGHPTDELPPLRTALRVLRETHAHVQVDQFTPRALVAVRDRMAALGWCRRSVNKQVARIRRVFRWGVAEMLVPAVTLTALEAVAPLKAGRSAAREKVRVTAIADTVVEATLPHLSACFLGAMGVAAGKLKVTLPADRAVDAEVDLGTGEGGYLLQARLNVSLPGLDREVAREIVDAAHQICPYSKATRGNIGVEINLV